MADAVPCPVGAVCTFYGRESSKLYALSVTVMRGHDDVMPLSSYGFTCLVVTSIYIGYVRYNWYCVRIYGT